MQIPRITAAELPAIERVLCRSLAEFVPLAWPNFDPATYVHNWHMDAMCEHLEAVANGEIRRLLINVPPGTSKSTLCNVIFPAWLWGPKGWPHKRIISAAHEQGLAVRDSRLMRNLIASEWYQERWPIRLAGDQNEKLYFENDHLGFRQANAVGSITGRRGDFVIWDDPHTPEQANSDADRERVIRIFRETLQTRLIDPARSAIIVIMQRLHENDLSGQILAHDHDFDHLCLPMEYDPARAKTTSIGWRDPRTEEGELLFPARFPPEVIEGLKQSMMEYGYAGQMQQLPTPREGGLFKVDQIRRIDAIPDEEITWCRAWDLAATDGAGAYTAGVLVGWRVEARRVIIADVKRARLGPDGVRKMIADTADFDSTAIPILIPQDPGQAGKAQARDFVARLAGHRVRIEPQTGAKEIRAEPLAAQIEAGNVDIVTAPWNRDFIEELRHFPRGVYKDQADAASSGFNAVAPKRQQRADLFAIGDHVGNKARPI